MRYIQGTVDYGLRYGSKNGCPLVLSGCVDASYARCIDTRKSRYGGILMLNQGPIEWQSKMEDVVALSSMEAEYIGACEMVRIITWIRGCLQEIGHLDDESPTRLGIDNTSAKMFAEEHMVQNRSKHIDVRYHYIRQQIGHRVVELVYQPTASMPADTLTKPLGPKLFGRFRNLIGIKRVTLQHDECNIAKLSGCVEMIE